MKEVFIIKIYGTERCFFKYINNNGAAQFGRLDMATRFADYPSAELYIKSNPEAFGRYTATEIKKYFVKDE